MADEESADLTGRRLGNYRIDGVLGRGGMSVMYRATDVRLGRKVALKVIGEHLGADAEFRERFVDEARNTSAIDHANIVPLYDFGELDGMLYIAMRLVDGSDLASLVGNGPMEPERALGLLEQVADALDTLHERGLVHLDVKPANVLVTSRESAREHVYIADFGLTRRGTTGHRTRSGDFLGSPTYAAPEHLRGEPLDGRTDQYALACMLFACLTGQPPFKGDVQTVIKGHLSGDVPSVSCAVPSLPPAIDEVVRKGMAKSADQRYSSCVELVEAARKALEGGADAAPDGSRQRPGQGEGMPMRPLGAQQGSGPVMQRGQQGQQGQQGPSGQQGLLGLQGPQTGPGQFGQPGQPGQPGQVGSPPQPGRPPMPGFPGGQPAAQPGQPPQPGYGPAPHAAPMASPYGTPPHGSPMPPPGGPPGHHAPAQGYGSAPTERSTPWWVWALAAVIVGAGVVLVLYLTLGSEEDRKGGTNELDITPSTTTSIPEIPIGPGGQQEVPDPGQPDNLPPTNIPIVPEG
ncbi:serine/threonine-protein kinase [Saccharomonospora sp.]|uniref:serine/threonine-protein kinase n=1 Tax=Saccharomonospora sp. TaxID=33913 RepID=UPI002635DE46|nr:serine/threonine-protein kinase [Saccharomonospora sp.]